MARTISQADITAAYGATADGSAHVTKQSPGTKAFMEAHYDAAGNKTRTLDQSNGRMDLYANSAAGQTAGPPIALTWNNVTPTNGDNLGHYAYRGKDSNGNYNTFAYVLANSTTVAAAGLYSSLTLGVMRNQAAGAGNAQPNHFITIDGSSNTTTFPSGMAVALSGASAPITLTHTSGPRIDLTNSANTRTLQVGVLDNFSGGVNTTGGGSTLIQCGGVNGVIVGGNGATRLQIETQSTKTADYPIVTGDLGTQFNNSGAAGTVVFTLPSAPTAGSRVGFTVLTAQTLRVLAPASTTINVGGALSASAGNIQSAQIGAYVELAYVGSNKWHAKMVTGTGGTAGAGGWTVT